MNYFTKRLFNTIFFVAWIAGFVIASGFWSTLFSVFIPLWSWYLVVEKFLIFFAIV